MNDLPNIQLIQSESFGEQLLSLLDSLCIAGLLLDGDARMLNWNGEFLRLFPEQAAHIHREEPYAENLRRFYTVRLDAGEMPSIDTYVAAGVERHFQQVEPFEFLHRGRWLRASVLSVPGVGRLRAWTVIRSPNDGDRLAAQVANSGKLSALTTMDEIPDGLMVRDPSGQITLCNRRFVDIYGLGSPGDALGRTFPALLDTIWDGSAGADEARRIWSDRSRFLGAPFELELPGDRWVRIRDHRLAGDSVVSTHVDVTSVIRLQRSAAEARRQAEELEAWLHAEIEGRKQSDARSARIAQTVASGNAIPSKRPKVDTVHLSYVKGVVDHINAEKGLTYVATGPLVGVGLSHRRFPEATSLVPGDLVEIGRMDSQGPPLDWRPAVRCELPGLFERMRGRLERKPKQNFALITCETCIVFVPASLAAAFEPGWAGDVSCWAVRRAHRYGTLGWRAVTSPWTDQTVTA